MLAHRVSRQALAALVSATFTSATFCSLFASETTRTPTEWLQAMEGAFRDLDYDGVFSYYTANHGRQAVFARESLGQGRLRERTFGFSSGYYTAKLTTFRIVHKLVDGIERERIVDLNGPRREILRLGDEVAFILQPGDNLLALKEAVPVVPYARVFSHRFDEVSDHYRVSFGGYGRVADRAALLLGVAPRDHDRFGYRLWLDRETGLLLRSELRDFAGANLEIFQFTALRVGDSVALADLEPDTEGIRVRHLAAPAPATETRIHTPKWQVRWVPSGFRMTSAAVRRAPDEQKDIDTLMFSDGLASLSVFIEAMPEAGAGSVVSRNGATVVLTHLAPGKDAVHGDHLVTVVGEVPLATARRIAVGVYRQP